MDSSGPIAFLDSGVGGLPYLELAKQLMPGKAMHYLADDSGFPYGTKSPREVEDLLMDRTRRIVARFFPSALVIACNTASQIALGALRTAYPELAIIGTVPAIKPAASSSRTGKIGVMATERTVVDPYIDDLIARYAPDVEVVKVPAQSLVTFVEKRMLDSTEEERFAAVEPFIRPLVDANVDRIVLACTHFLHLEGDIDRCAKACGGRGVEIVDSRRGVVNRLVDVARGLGAIQAGDTRGQPGKGSFLLTSEPPFDPLYAAWAERFGLAAPSGL